MSLQRQTHDNAVLRCRTADPGSAPPPFEVRMQPFPLPKPQAVTVAPNRLIVSRRGRLVSVPSVALLRRLPVSTVLITSLLTACVQPDCKMLQH